MKIAAVIYSQTGNTLLVARQIQARLSGAGHEVTLLRVSPDSGGPPDVAPFDAVLFGAPVHAFSLAPLMKDCLRKIGPLNGKTTACFVTQSAPVPWMGGSRAIAWMRKALREKGGLEPSVTGIIHWKKPDLREQGQSLLIDRLAKLFSA